MTETIKDLQGREKYLFELGRLMGMNQLAGEIKDIHNKLIIPIGVELASTQEKVFEKNTNDLWHKNLTWRCEVCCQERPDDKISVFQRPVKYGHENIKFCNDKTSCATIAATHGLFELRRMAKENEDEIS